MRKLKIIELKSLILEEVKKKNPEERPKIGREVPQIPYPEARTTQAVENLKKVVGKELTSFGARMLVATLIDMSFSKLHKLRADEKDMYDFYQKLYLKARELLAFIKESSPY